MTDLDLEALVHAGLTGAAARADMLGAPVGAEQSASRSCGTCLACCSALGVEAADLNKGLGLVKVVKPAGTPCPHERTGKRACRVYDRRPIACRLYKCWWLRGWGTLGVRPDRSKLVVDDEVDIDWINVMGGVPVVMVAEVQPGIFGPRLAPLSAQPKIVRDLAADRVVLLRYWGDLHPSIMQGPRALLEIVQAGEGRLLAERDS